MQHAAPDQVHALGSPALPWNTVNRRLHAWLDHPGLWLATSAVLVLATLVKLLRPPLNGDIGFLLHVAGRLLDGAVLYRDIIETNPPLIFYLALPAVYLSRLLGISPIVGFYTSLTAVALASVWTCQRLLRFLPLLNRWGLRVSTLFLVALFLPLAYPHQGQREYLTLLTFTPYLLLTALRTLHGRVPTGLAVSVGLAAGIGLAIKPFFLFVWVLFLLYALKVAGWRSLLHTAENWCIALIQPLYAITVLIGFPDFQRGVRMTLQFYSAYNTGFRDVLAPIETIVVIVFALWIIFARPVPRYRAMLHLSMLAAAGFWLMMVLQKKGFTYHFLLVDSYLLLTLFLLGLDLISRRITLRRMTHVRRPTAAGLGSLAIVIWAVHLLLLPPPAIWEVEQLRPFVKRYAVGKPLLVLDSTLWVAFPLVNETGALWTSPFNCLWMIPGLYPKGAPAAGYHSREQMSTAERFFVDTVVDDFVRNRPALLIVNTSREGRVAMSHLPWFNFLEYFGRDPRFARAFQDYEQVPLEGVYQVYRRRDN